MSKKARGPRATTITATRAKTPPSTQSERPAAKIVRAGEALGAKRVSNVVASELLKAITNKSIVDDQNRLPSERELADRFQVSRTSIREALLHLQAVGVIEIPNRARARLVDYDSSAFYEQLTTAARVLMSKQQLYEFQEARALFEGGLVRYAARHATPKQIGRLTAALMENESAQEDPPRFIETDMAFHRVLAEIPDNPIFLSMQTAIETWFAEQRTETFAPPAKARGDAAVQDAFLQAIRESFAGHEAIVKAVQARDPELAERAMSEHLMLVFTYVLQARNRLRGGGESDSGTPALLF